MDEYTERAIDTMVQRPVERFGPEQIILFGSHGAAPLVQTAISIYSWSCRLRVPSARSN